MKKLMIFILVLASSAMFVNALKGFEVHGGLSMPSGAFADNTFETGEENLPYVLGAGCATTGINLELSTP